MSDECGLLLIKKSELSIYFYPSKTDKNAVLDCALFPSVESYPHGIAAVGAIIDLIIVSKPCKLFLSIVFPKLYCVWVLQG